MADAVFNVGHASLLTLGLAQGDWELVARGLADRLHQPYRAHLYPRTAQLVERARDFGALGATVSGAGPTVLVWSHLEQTPGVVRGAAPRGRWLGGRHARAVRADGRGRARALAAQTTARRRCASGIPSRPSTSSASFR